VQFIYFWGLKQDDQPSGSEGEPSIKSESMPLLATAASDNTNADASSGDVNRSISQSPNGDAPHQQQPLDESHAPEEEPTLGEKICGILGDLKESFLLVVSHRAILWRLVFFGFELAFEDASIVVLAAQVGIRAEWMGGGAAVKGSIWTSVIVAVGKLGAAVASFGMMQYYQPPENIMGHTKLFICIGLSTLVILGVPLAFDGYSSGAIGADAARAVTLLSFLLYFFLSTLPKLGLMSLLQTMVSQVENGWRAFAFIAILATTIDSVVIMGLSLLFTDADKSDDKAFSHSLWVTCYIFMAHGLLETLFGPFLVLRPAAADAVECAKKEAEAAAKSPRGDAADGGFANRVPSSLAAQPTEAARRPSSPRGLAVDEQFGGGEPLQPGQYSARAVSVPVPIVHRPSGLGGAAGGPVSPRLAGGTSPRLGYGGVSPRPAYGTIPQSPRSGLHVDGGAAAHEIVMQHQLGRMGGSLVAASVLIPRRSGLGQHGHNAAGGEGDATGGAGSFSRSGKAPSRLG
jgi:hypothetical protein